MLAFNKSLLQTADGVRLAAMNVAADLFDRGFEETEAVEMMLADNFDPRLAETAVSSVYNGDDEDEEFDTRPRFAMVVPTRYDDIAPLVEGALRRHTARKFVALLTRSAQPIVRISAKNEQSLIRIARAAKANASFRPHLHDMLRPWCEDALLNSVLLSEEQTKRRQRKVISTDEAKTYKVVTASRAKKRVGEEVAAPRTACCHVCLVTGTCTCSKYVEGNFGQFGLPCEHLVAVADIASPHERLRRSVRPSELAEADDDEE